MIQQVRGAGKVAKAQYPGGDTMLIRQQGPYVFSEKQEILEDKNSILGVATHKVPRLMEWNGNIIAVPRKTEVTTIDSLFKGKKGKTTNFQFQ